MLALIGGEETPQAAQMRRALLQIYSFEQKRQLVEKVVERGQGGFYLNADGTVSVKGALDARDPLPAGAGNLIRRPRPMS